MRIVYVRVRGPPGLLAQVELTCAHKEGGRRFESQLGRDFFFGDRTETGPSVETLKLN